jgi:single-strand DNA-binding protein
MNKTILIGNLTRDPRISMTSSGKRVAQMDIACNRAGRDGQQTADYYQISFWEERAKLAETLHKGDKILVEGRLTARGYQGKDGTIRAALEMSDPRLEYLSPRRAVQEDAPTAPVDPESGMEQAEPDDCPW